MADEEEQATEEGAENKEEEPKKGGPSIVGLVLPALLAGAGAFGGAFFGQSPAPAAEPTEASPAEKVPGPTVPLSPFVLNVQDTEGSAHAAKVTFAIELAAGTDPKAFEVFLPRIRDTCLTYLRAMTFEELADNKGQVKMTSDLLAAITKQGAEAAKQVLVQDFVVQ